MEQSGNRIFGAQAERVAVAWLRQQGYKILERNIRLTSGELDLVAKQGDVLVFCEIKARRTSGRGEPGEAIDGRKQSRLVRLAADYLQSHPELANLECRFDAVLLWKTGWRWQAEVIPDAFRPGWE